MSPFDKAKKRDDSDSEEESKTKKKQKKKMDVDSEDEGSDDHRAKKPKGIKKKTIFDDDSGEEEQAVAKSKAAPKGSGKFSKEGWLFKRKRSKVMTQWDKRYVVLENSKLYFYTSSDKKTLKKTFDIASGQVTQVCFHYDKDAPVQSKRLDIKDKDDSRFDIYVKTPIVRAIMLRVEDMNQFQAEDWVEMIQGAINYYAPPYDPEMSKGAAVKSKK